MKDKIRDTMTQYLNNFEDLEEYEIKIINDYIGKIIEQIGPILSLQHTILTDKGKQDEFKNMIADYVAEKKDG